MKLGFALSVMQTVNICVWIENVVLNSSEKLNFEKSKERFRLLLIQSNVVRTLFVSSVEIQCKRLPANFVCFSTGFIDYWFLANDTTRICHASLVNSFIFVSQSLFLLALFSFDSYSTESTWKMWAFACFTLSRAVYLLCSRVSFFIFFLRTEQCPRRTAAN